MCSILEVGSSKYQVIVIQTESVGGERIWAENAVVKDPPAPAHVRPSQIIVARTGTLIGMTSY